MNFAIIGLGYWGKNYYRILNSNDKINLSAIVDSNQNINLDEGIKHFPDLEDLLNSEINNPRYFSSITYSSFFKGFSKFVFQ